MWRLPGPALVADRGTAPAAKQRRNLARTSLDLTTWELELLVPYPNYRDFAYSENRREEKRSVRRRISMRSRN
jgi:hypothetical protein